MYPPNIKIEGGLYTSEESLTSFHHESMELGAVPIDCVVEQVFLVADSQVEAKVVRFP